MRTIKVFVDDIHAGFLHEIERNKNYRFDYLDNYSGNPVSLLMPITKKTYMYERFPPFFEGLLPEGIMLESLLRQSKIDKDDLLSQLIMIGSDMVGNVTVEEYYE